MSSGRRFAGVLLIILGALFFLHMNNIISFSYVPLAGFLRTFWPLFLIIAGILVMYRKGWLAVIFIIAMVITAGYLYAERSAKAPVRLSVQEIPYDSGIKELKVSLGYGAGTFSLSEDSERLFSNSIRTTDLTDPKMIYEKSGETGTLSIERTDAQVNIAKPVNEWKVGVTGKAPVDMELKYGAADMDIDLRGLMVRTLKMEGGAARTDITFSGYPTKATIDTGASSVILKIPKNASAAISFEGGVSSAEFPGFERKGDIYYSSAYDKDADSIEITVRAGASSIRGELY